MRIPILCVGLYLILVSLFLRGGWIYGGPWFTGPVVLVGGDDLPPESVFVFEREKIVKRSEYNNNNKHTDSANSNERPE